MTPGPCLRISKTRFRRVETWLPNTAPVETAIKLARQIHLEAGRAQRFRLISRWKSHHGLTLGGHLVVAIFGESFHLTDRRHI